MGNLISNDRFSWKLDLPDIRDQSKVFEQSEINSYVTNINLKSKLLKINNINYHNCSSEAIIIALIFNELKQYNIKLTNYYDMSKLFCNYNQQLFTQIYNISSIKNCSECIL